MKRSIICLIVIVFALSATTVQAQIRIGATGGLNVTKLVYDGPDLDSKASIHIGAIGEYEIMDGLSAQSGLIISGKGGKSSFLGDKIVTSLTYLDIPLHAIYKYDLGSLSIYGKSGFDIGIGVAGKYKYDGEKESINWGSGDNDDLKRIQLGFYIGAGVELMDNLQLGLGYNWGLNDISASGTGDVKNRVFTISATYFFAEL
jgi:opacity protein-like surface antigen